MSELRRGFEKTVATGLIAAIGVTGCAGGADRAPIAVGYQCPEGAELNIDSVDNDSLPVITTSCRSGEKSTVPTVVFASGHNNQYSQAKTPSDVLCIRTETSLGEQNTIEYVRGDKVRYRTYSLSIVDAYVRRPNAKTQANTDYCKLPAKQ